MKVAAKEVNRRLARKAWNVRGGLRSRPTRPSRDVDSHGPLACLQTGGTPGDAVATQRRALLPS
eukprot:7603544-Alexandrium_andersonii.AAC.1